MYLLIFLLLFCNFAPLCFLISCLKKIVMGQPNFRHSDCQLCIFLQPYTSVSIIIKQQFRLLFHFFFFLSDDLLSAYTKSFK
jgi:hypothetical protein